MHLGLHKHIGGRGRYDIDYFIVGGGGGSLPDGSGSNNGGGGGGGTRQGTMELKSGDALTILIGAGGAYGADGNGSSIFGLVAAPPGKFTGQSGNGFAKGVTQSVLSTYGSPIANGGGGGAAEAGDDGYIINGSGCQWGGGGDGGDGVSSDISGVATYYGGGGGGMGTNVPIYCTTSHFCGLHGLGYGQNKGGGGGFTEHTSGGGYVGADSGVVIIRYPGPQRGEGGTVTSITIEGREHTVHTFTTSGSFTA